MAYNLEFNLLIVFEEIRRNGISRDLFEENGQILMTKSFVNIQVTFLTI